jgi:hypothetical protein
VLGGGGFGCCGWVVGRGGYGRFGDGTWSWSFWVVIGGAGVDYRDAFVAG